MLVVLALAVAIVGHGGHGYTATRGSISITGLAVTDLACTTPPGVLDQEREYLAALAKVTHYDVDPRGLQLLSAHRRLLANYARGHD